MLNILSLQIGQLKSKLSIFDLSLAKKDDHIANLNEKLLETTYILDDLRVELSNKSSAINDFEQNQIKWVLNFNILYDFLMSIFTVP